MAAAGTQYITTVTSPLTREDCLQTLLGGLAGVEGCTVTMAGDRTVIVTRRFTPTWAVVVGVVGILLFLVGLLAFLVKTTETLTITLADTADGTRITVTGVTSAELAQRLNAINGGLQAGDLTPRRPTTLEQAW